MRRQQLLARDMPIDISGPRALKDPRSKAYAIQTVQALKRLLDTVRIERELVQKELDEIRQYRHWEVLGYPDEQALFEAEGVAKTKLAQVLAADPAVERQRKHGKVSGDAPLFKSNQHSSTSAERLVRRLKRDAPEIAAALARGEYPSARAAAIAAGIVRVPSVLDRLRRLWSKATDDEREAFAAEAGLVREEGRRA